MKNKMKNMSNAREQQIFQFTNGDMMDNCTTGTYMCSKGG